MQGKDCQSCQFEVNPELVDLPLAKERSVKLSVKVKRPWVGRIKHLQIEAKALLSDLRLGSTDPATQLLTLKLFPIVPTWLLLFLLALLIALLAVILKPAPISHVATVTSVQFSDTSGRFPLVLSGAKDCAIRTWTFTETAETLNPQGALPKKFMGTPCRELKPQSSKGLLAITEYAVRVLELIRVNNNQAFVFAGLENGEIKVWDVNTGEYLYKLKDSKDLTNDQVLSLAFTNNSRYLYSSYGSGSIRKWQIPLNAQSSSNPQLLKLPDRSRFGSRLQAWAIALSPDQKVLVSAGQYKSLIRWDLSKPKPIPTEISIPSKFGSQGVNDYFWNIAFAPKTQLLGTADSDGFITLWNINKCQTIKSSHPESLSSQLPKTECEIYARWQASPEGKDIRSIRFTPSGKKLVTAGDDGKIVVWTISKKYPTKQQVVATHSSGITSIDLIVTAQQRILIASGSQDSLVRIDTFQQK
jgi:WD40 repeat protein